MNAPIKPIIGDRNNAAKILINPCAWTASMPPNAIAAPMSPPNKDCEILDGIFSHNVNALQMTAPTSPAVMTVG